MEKHSDYEKQKILRAIDTCKSVCSKINEASSRVGIGYLDFTPNSFAVGGLVGGSLNATIGSLLSILVKNLSSIDFALNNADINLENCADYISTNIAEFSSSYFNLDSESLLTLRDNIRYIQKELQKEL